MCIYWTLSDEACRTSNGIVNDNTVTDYTKMDGDGNL
jgi:hypothetical protein